MPLDPDVLQSDLAKEPILSEEEIAIRVLFVHEYLKDFNPLAATLRCGFIDIVAKEYANSFMNDTYVQRLISEKLKIQKAQEHEESYAFNDPEKGKESVLINLHKIAAGIIEVSPQTVQALKMLYEHYHMQEMHKPKKETDKNMPRGGVMRLPALVDVDSWEQKSLASQTKLKQDVRD